MKLVPIGWNVFASFLNIGWPELVLILVILVFIFGATRLKDLAKGIGESVREFKKATSEPVPKEKDEEEAIIEAARKMGIRTEGKDVKQIISEMSQKAGIAKT